MNFNVITLFPELVESAIGHGVVGQAVKRQDIKLNIVNPRSFTSDVHHTVDDRPFGGGDGMIMLEAPLRAALSSIEESRQGLRVLLSAHGQRWNDQLARKWASEEAQITFICGRYAGVDQRFINECVDIEISIGDYILSGGELASLVLMDSLARFLPGVLGNSISCQEESFSDGLLESPLFTRPRDNVPHVFLSGDHSKIKMARRILSLLITMQKRPDLFQEAHRVELAKNKAYINQLFTLEELKICGLDANCFGEWLGKQ